MKKSFIFVLFICCSFMYAATVKLNAIDDGNVTITNNSVSSTATFITEDNVEISLMATDADEENIKLALQITNNGTEDFNFNENSITASEGVFEKNNWAAITYYPASKYYSIKEYEYGAAVTVAAVGCGLLLADILLAEACDDDPPPARPAPKAPAPRAPKASNLPPARNGPGRVPAPAPVRRPPRPANNVSVDIDYDFGALFALAVESSDSMDYLKNNLMYSCTVAPGTTAAGVFFIEKNIGPDYKITLNIPSREPVDFYFSRSDKHSVLYPWEDNGQARFCCLLSMQLPQPAPGVYFIYSGVPVGAYFGTNYEYPGRMVDHYWGVSDCEYYSEHYNPDYNYSFESNGESKSEIFSIYAGLDVKLVPHTWLLLGCGVDFETIYLQGNEIAVSKADASKTYTNPDVWIKSSKENVYCSPQIGVNLIYNILDIAGTFSYRIGDGPKFNLMIGVAL